MDTMNRSESYSRFLAWFMASLLVALAAGCGSGTTNFSSIAVTPATASIPIGGTQHFVATGTSSAGATFDISNTATWTSDATAVATVVSPGVATGVSTGTATITATSGVNSGSATLTVTAAQAQAPVPVLGTAANFVVLAQTEITDVPTSAITGNIGVSPISGAFIAPTCAEVKGTIFSVDTAGPLPCRLTDPTLLTSAVGNMQTAYTDAAGRPAGVGPFLNVGAGTLTSQTLIPGIYTWSSNVTIPTNLTLSGGVNDVWIFQITGTLDISPNMQVLLIGGAQAKNIFWQVAGAVTLGTSSHIEGIILAKTNIAMLTNASINGRLLSQTAVTLQQNVVTQPGP